MDFLTLVSRLVEALAWPVLIFVLLKKFEEPIIELVKPIGDKLKNLVKAKHKDTEFIFNPQDTKTLPKIEKEPIKIEKSSNATGLQKKFEDAIYSDLKKSTFANKDETINALVGSLATTQIRAAYERLYGAIFGSQIKLLIHLNTTTAPVNVNIINSFYTEASITFPEVYNKYSFDNYLNFLKDNNLIEKKETGYIITETGIGFLTFLTVEGFLLTKPY